MKTPRKLAALVGAGALVFAMAGTAAAVTDFATVSSHAASTSDNNSADFWGDNCTKVDGSDPSIANGTSYVLGADYGEVIVKAGSSNGDSPNSLTIFDNPTAGQTVWADSNGNNTYDPGGPGGDKTISHIIFCDQASSTTTTTTTTTTDTTTDTTTTTTDTFTQTVSDTTNSQPPTDTIGSTGSGQQSGATWLLIAGLGALLGSVIVLAPARAKTRQ